MSAHLVEAADAEMASAGSGGHGPRGQGLTIWPVTGVPEVAEGDDVAALILTAWQHQSSAGRGDIRLQDGDVLVVSSKVVSKAEGRRVRAADREEAITAETVRVVAAREHPGGVTRIVENHLGLVMAAAGVDASNTPEGTVLLLPADPDASARAIRAAVRSRTGVSVGVLISDTAGRAWRQGVTDMAVGAAGVRVLDDLRGTRDADGRELSATVVCVADELAAASELVRGKSARVAAAVIRGAGRWTTTEDGPGARAIVRLAGEDMFRRGSDEAYQEGFAAGLAAGRTGSPG